MIMTMLRKQHTILCALAAVVWTMTACVRDFEELEPAGQEGEETVIALNISVPEVTVATRADLPDGADTQLNSLWVGIFNSRTGELTYGHHLSPAEIGAAQKQNHGAYYSVNNIKTRAGSSYIVAVGNYADNDGYKYDPSDGGKVQPVGTWGAVGNAPADRTVLLPEYQYKADGPKPAYTWDDYCFLAYGRSRVGTIDVPSGNLVMSGVYVSQKHTDGSGPSHTEWETLCRTSYEIPVSKQGETITLPGAIYLRRLMSQIKFRIRADRGAPFEMNGEKLQIVSITPKTYTVHNVPTLSWIHERSLTQEGGTTATNAGDILKVSRIGGSKYVGDLPLKANYQSSLTYRGKQNITSRVENGETVYEFDFWMLENKRRAVDDVSSYYEREREQKTEATSGEGEKPRFDNTGIYTALCGENGQETYNNCAAYVAIECDVDYTAPGMEDLHKDEDYKHVITRTASVTYLVHLGGINEDFRDFASRRNHKYTYNAKVVDVKTLVVEARGEEGDENRPGFEGVVTDTTEPPFTLDAHYNVFNICFTNAERTSTNYNKNAKFTFRVEVYDVDDHPGERLIIDQDNIDDFHSKYSKYWDWVEFRATSGPEVLAAYVPYGKNPADLSNQSDKKNRTFRLTDMMNFVDFPPYEGYKENDTDKHWYTVFINEYVYEVDEDGNRKTDETADTWAKYVNQPDRRVWLNTAGEVSSDKETVYIESKYMITQKSIQTFYDIKNEDVSERDFNAIGLEHINETFGVSLYWEDYNGGNYFLNNGRYNQWLYLTTKWEANKQSWDTYESVSDPEKMVKVVNPGQGRDYESKVIQNFTPYLRSLKKQNTGPYSYDYDNPSDWYIDAMKVCLNRNRDNNGDGQISIDELRWYLPASGELLDMVVGRNSLETPLIDYDAYNSITNVVSTTYSGTNPQWGHWYNTYLHFAASNKRSLWAEEGMTTSEFPTNTYGAGQYNKRPWDARCTRVLGVHIGQELNADNLHLTPAFQWKSGGATYKGSEVPRYIYPTYFEEQTLRPYYATPIPAHSEASPLNRICYYGFEMKNEALMYTGSNVNPLRKDNNYVYYTYTNNNDLRKDVHDSYANKASDLCKEVYGGNWRLPTLKECALMKAAWNAVGFNMGDASKVVPEKLYNYLSCTYREYGIDPQDGVNNNYYATFTRDGTGNYCGIVTDTGDWSSDRWKDRINILTQPNSNYYIRCVRDLKEGEFADIPGELH